MSVFPVSQTSYRAEVMRDRRRYGERFGEREYGSLQAALEAAKAWEQRTLAEIAAGRARPRLVRGVTPRRGACTICSWWLADPATEICGSRDNGCCYRRREGAAA